MTSKALTFAGMSRKNLTKQEKAEPEELKVTAAGLDPNIKWDYHYTWWRVRQQVPFPLSRNETDCGHRIRQRDRSISIYLPASRLLHGIHGEV
eukprot:scaffold90216_cov40-Prasinocladus_malaysianus.AAC.1